MNRRHQLIIDIEAFCTANGLSDRRFSLLATGNENFMRRIRVREITTLTLAKAEDFLRRCDGMKPDEIAALPVPRITSRASASRDDARASA